MKYFTCLDRDFNTPLYALRVDNCSDIVESLNIPKFYKECIVCFQEMLKKSKKIRSRENELIWDNSEVIFNNKTLRNKRWARRGVLTREDICTGWRNQ